MAVTPNDAPMPAGANYGIEELHIPASFQYPFSPDGQQYISNPFAGRILRGQLEQLASNTILDFEGNELRTGLRLGLRFFFNPSVLNFSYNLRNDLYTPGQQTAEEQDVRFLPDTRAFALELLFDRTYEVYRGMVENSPAGVGAGPRALKEVGVLEDIRQLERMIGINEEGLPLVGVPLIFYPSGKGSNEAYTGAFSEIRCYIQSMNVAYTMFSHNMVPVRAAVDIQLMQTYSPQTGSTVAYSSLFPYIDPNYDNPNDVTPGGGAQTAPPGFVPGGTTQ
jgi:hypothetical protein